MTSRRLAFQVAQALGASVSQRDAEVETGYPLHPFDQQPLKRRLVKEEHALEHARHFLQFLSAEAVPDLLSAVAAE